MNLIIKKYSGLLLFMIVYLVISFLMLTYYHSFFYVMLVWNMMLATLPLFFIEFSVSQYKSNKYVGAIVLGLLWIIFFPNSVYMVTDLIHINSDKLVWQKATARYSFNNGVMYSNDIMQWIKLLVIGIGVVYGILIGMESLNVFYRFLNQRVPKLMSYIIIAGVSLISGFAVYIGRFLRFNSWDLLRPLSLFRDIINNINVFAIKFMFAFAGFILILFLLYVSFSRFMAETSKQK